MSAPFRIAGVIGDPVSHSLSPRLHTMWLEKLGIGGAYVPLEVKSEAFPAALAGLKTLGFAGANVTLPHKEAACRLVDSRDPVAAAVGAVNTLVITGGRIEGRNTDGEGFLAYLAAVKPDWKEQLSSRPALILGAGGAARGILYALLAAGVRRVLIANRTKERALALAAALGRGASEAIAWDELDRAIRDAGLIVNATSLGMRGQPALGLDLRGAARGTIVYDLVYNPLRTALLRQAESHGLVAIDGLGMLIHQARAGFKAWFGVVPPASDDIYRRLAAFLSSD